MPNNPNAEPSVLYVVCCSFAPAAEQVADNWIGWLREQHLAEVIAAGALSAEVFRISSTEIRYEIHYRFASDADFARYERDHAPRLRADGLARFPLDLGLQYERRTGLRLFSL